MEKTDMKYPIVMEEPKKPSVAGKYIAMMAASVAFLALAFIVVIGVGAHVLGNQECETTAVAPAPHPHSTVQSETQARSNNKTILTEHTTMYVEDQLEFIVSRHPESGLVANVITIDYQKEVTTMYHAEWNVCFMVRGGQHTMDEDLDYLRQQQHGGPVETGEKRRYLRMNDKVENPDDIPTQMAPFCSTKNSIWLADANDEEDRAKRDISCATYIHINGYGWYLLQWTQSGNGPCVFPCCALAYYYNIYYISRCCSGSNGYPSACPSLAGYC